VIPLWLSCGIVNENEASVVVVFADWLPDSSWARTRATINMQRRINNFESMILALGGSKEVDVMYEVA